MNVAIVGFILIARFLYSNSVIVSRLIACSCLVRPIACIAIIVCLRIIEKLTPFSTSTSYWFLPLQQAALSTQQLPY